MVQWFRFGLEKAYSDELAECPVALLHVSWAGATCVSRRSDSEGEVEDGPSTSKPSLRTFLLKGKPMQLKSGTKQRNTLQKPKKDRASV